MTVLQALRRSPGALLGTPALVVPMLVLFAFQLPQMVLQSTNPLLASLLSFGVSALMLVVTPFVQAGAIGMADEALDGGSSLRAFFAYGKRNFVQVLAAYLLLLLVIAVLSAALFAVGVGVFLFAPNPRSAALVVLGIAAAVLLLVYALVGFFVQFYAHAIVLENRSAVEGFKRSYGVVRSNLVATAGYVVLALLFSGAFGLVFGGLSLLTMPESAAELGLPALSTPGIVGVGLVVTVLGAAFSAFLLVYSVAFYRLASDAAGARPERDEPPSTS